MKVFQSDVCLTCLRWRRLSSLRRRADVSLANSFLAHRISLELRQNGTEGGKEASSSPFGSIRIDSFPIGRLTSKIVLSLIHSCHQHWLASPIDSVRRGNPSLLPVWWPVSFAHLSFSQRPAIVFTRRPCSRCRTVDLSEIPTFRSVERKKYLR